MAPDRKHAYGLESAVGRYEFWTIDLEQRKVTSRAEFAGRHSWESRLEEICGLIEMTAAMKGMATKARDAGNARCHAPANAGRWDRPVGGPT